MCEGVIRKQNSDVIMESAFPTLGFATWPTIAGIVVMSPGTDAGTEIALKDLLDVLEILLRVSFLTTNAFQNRIFVMVLLIVLEF